MLRERGIIFLAVIAIGVLLGGAYYFNSKSTVPAAGEPGWLLASDAVQGVTFQYPAKLDLAYYQLLNDGTRMWPPKVQVTTEPFTCAQAVGGPGFGTTELHTVTGREYCVTLISDAGMSQLWRSYTYAFVPEQGRVATFSFTVHSTNECGVYDDGKEPNLTYKACLSEKALFTPAYLDDIIDRMARTVRLLPRA